MIITLTYSVLATHYLFSPVIVPPRTEYIAAVGTDVSEILLFNRFGRQIQRLPLHESSRPSALSFDPIDGYFYYTDVQENFIGRVRLDDINQFDIIIRNGIESKFFVINFTYTGNTHLEYSPN